MAHEISFANGRAEAMFSNRPAWHGLGEVFDRDGRSAPDSATAIELASLAWEVGKQAIFLADGSEIPDNFALVRQDTGHTLSIVGNEYRTLQNVEAFRFLDSLLQDGVMRYESAFALQGGRQVCLLARMPSVDTIAAGDTVLRYILFSASHGGGAIRTTPTAVRVVCANTQRLALSRSTSTITVRHSGDLQSKLTTAQRYLSQFDAAFTLYREQAQTLLKGYSAAQAAEYINALFPAPADGSTERVKNAYSRLMDQIGASLRDEPQNVASIRGTWWSLFNAITQTVDHGQPARQSRDLRARAENRFLNVTQGDGANVKDRALDLALSLSA